MGDPRESKLPAWAREQIEALRIHAALAWPSEPNPEPWFNVNGGAGGPLPAEARNTCAWWVHIPHVGRAHVAAVYIDQWGVGHRSPEMSGIGSRLTGPHYRTERDALLAGQWLIAERAAKALRETAKMIDALDAR